ncbi:DUF481 domain-containing protein [Sulfurimonas sp.]
MKSLLFVLLFTLSLYAKHTDTNTTVQKETQEHFLEAITEPVVIKDQSGLSDDEVREKALKNDKKEVNLNKWEDLSPTPNHADWIQTKKGEWFKGEIEAMYDDELEFDSDEVGTYTFDLKDIKQILSHNIIDVNIEGVASISGIIRYKNDKINIIQGDTDYTFYADQIVSFAKSGEKERNYWSGKATISIDIRRGNKNKFDYTANATVLRRTASTRLRLDYIGRISKTGSVTTAEDHRLNQKYDIYLTRNFFWTPLFSEYYSNIFQNITQQITLGVGIGYTIVHKNEIEWDVSGGPAYLSTHYVTVTQQGVKNPNSLALELSTRFEYKLSNKTDIIYKYRFAVTDKDSGAYKHHMLLTFENEILDWLDFDITTLWDRTEIPVRASDGVLPQKDDYQLLLGFAIEF